MTRFCFIACVLVVGCIAQLPPGRADANPSSRHAVVMGNGEYEFLPRIPNATREAAVISESLRKDGFDVLQITDFRYPDFVQTTEPTFISRIKTGDTCFVYFSGYSVQAFGETYLLPVNLNPKATGSIQQAYSLTRLLQFLSEEKKAGIKVVAMEASREVTLFENVSAAGPAPPDLSEARQILFAFAAPPGQVTPARNGVGLFTQTVAQELLKPGLGITEAFLQVQRQVARISGQNQFPYVSGNVTSELILNPSVTAEPRYEQKKDDVLPLGIPAVNARDREEYVWIPGGKFFMGCVAEDAKCERQENPRHQVTITHGFWMGRNEVQVISYRRFVDATRRKMPSGPIWDTKWKQENHPVVNVSWQDAEAYCEWAGGLLPTEAQWEYAARGNVLNQIYPYGENSREKANFYGKAGNDTFDFTAPVRHFDPNPFKLFDMSGNVWEWVRDLYGGDYFEQSAETDPTGPGGGKEHVVRGGSFDSDPKQHLRISFRRPFGKPANNVGFRCVLEDTPKTQDVLRGVK